MFSDAGSTPAASTIYIKQIQQLKLSLLFYIGEAVYIVQSSTKIHSSFPSVCKEIQCRFHLKI